MKPTLLLDLDDTLVKNDIDEFLPQYLRSFSTFVADKLDPNLFVRSLLAGTQAMVENRQPDCTLREVFKSVFYPLTRVDPATFQVVSDEFYDEIFPRLRSLTEPIPQAAELVSRAFERGYHLAITTNPLFPRRAIDHRLSWANLPAERFQFDLVTSYETFHFAKPDPAFFAEALGRLGWPDGPVIVIGDDCDRDIGPASDLGLASYCVNANGDLPRSGEDYKAASGSLEGLLDWLDRSSEESILPDFTTPKSWLATIRATPAVLDSFTRALPFENWTTRPEEGEWSLVEILCHLRDVDREVNLPRLNNVLQSTNPFLAGQDTDPWSEIRQYRRQDGRQAIRQFFVGRHELVALLENLTAEDWQRPARHAIFGPTRLQELVNILAAHDRLHIRQIRKLLEHIAPELLIA